MERMVDDMGDEPSGAVVEIRRAVGDFVHDFKGFQDDMTTKLQQTEERMTMLDRK
ncbi:MAG: phage major capsid protein, partial [Sulfitobacter sp.]